MNDLHICPLVTPCRVCTVCVFHHLISLSLYPPIPLSLISLSLYTYLSSLRFLPKQARNALTWLQNKLRKRFN